VPAASRRHRSGNDDRAPRSTNEVGGDVDAVRRVAVPSDAARPRVDRKRVIVLRLVCPGSASVPDPCQTGQDSFCACHLPVLSDAVRTDAMSSLRRVVTRSLSVRVGAAFRKNGAPEGGNLYRHWLSQERTRLRCQHRVSYSCRSARPSALRTVLRYRATLRFRSLRSTWCACGETRRRRMSVASSTLRSGRRAP